MEVNRPEDPPNLQTDSQNSPREIEVPNQDPHPSSTQFNMQEEPDHAGCTRKRKSPSVNRPLHGTPPNQDLSPTPTQAIPSQTKRTRHSQNPTHILKYHSALILTPPLLPPTIPSTDTATWLWNYKQNKANEIGVQATQSSAMTM
eukprot:893091-Pelagomonas_calceolata.AAC.1